MRSLSLPDFDACRPISQPFSVAGVGGRTYVREGTPDHVVGCPCEAAIGVFDGLHRAHQTLLATMVGEAHRLGLPAVTVTFDPDPVRIVGAPSHTYEDEQILSLDDRVRGLLSVGADAVVALDFNEALRARTPESFVDIVLSEVVRPHSVHVGRNFRFGRGAEGDLQTLSDLASTRGFAVVGHELMAWKGKTISSTRVRRSLASSRIREANDLLGRFHFVRGVVIHGRGEGAALGFPTANVSCHEDMQLPAEGVYACYVSTEAGVYPAAANVGAPPTFSGERRGFLEANLIGFDGDLYEQEVTVSFVEWLRASAAFSSCEELERVVLGNIDWVRQELGDSRLSDDAWAKVAREGFLP